MKKTFPFIGIFFLLTLIIGCEKDSEIILINESNLLFGHWVNPVYSDSETTFERSSSLKKNAYGVTFLENEVCVIRSSGWCGTPPLVFSDFQGNWHQDDELVTFDNEMNLPGKTKWRIISLDEYSLRVERLE